MKITAPLNPNRPDVNVRAQCFLASCEPASKGERNGRLNQVAYALGKKFKLSSAQHTSLLASWAASFDPPYAGGEVLRTISSAWNSLSNKGELGSEDEDSGPMLTRAQGKTQAGLAPPTFEAPKDGASQAVFERIEAMCEGAFSNLHWPWKALSRLARALLPGTMTLLCAPPGAAKSFLMLEALSHWVSEGTKCAILEMEETDTFHLHRALAQVAGNAGLLSDDWCSKNKEKAMELAGVHSEHIDAMGACVWGRPEQATGDSMATWVEDRIKDGARTVIIDPITAKDTVKDIWVEDHKLVDRLIKATAGSDTSLILVTHPNGRICDAETLQSNPMADFSGGQAWQRFTQCCLYLRPVKLTQIKVKVSMGLIDAQINRHLEVRKARNGPGDGAIIGMYFDRDTFRHTEKGLIV